MADPYAVTATEPGSTERWRLDLSYDGRDFSGWATQPDRRTVQGVLEEWIPKVLRLPDPVAITCAGRTDAGVHARGQVAHVDLPAGSASVEVLRRRLARVLPADIVVRRVAPAPAGFDARFSANWRRYCYRLDDTGSPDPLLRGHVLTLRDPLDLDAMNAAGSVLLGLHDFAAFCKPRAGATTIRTLLDLHAERTGTVEVTLRADAFCHSMVRSVLGALVAVGTGRRDQAWLVRTLATRRRAHDVTVLPAHGLCLEEVDYPPADRLADRAAAARTMRTAAETPSAADPATRSDESSPPKESR